MAAYKRRRLAAAGWACCQQQAVAALEKRFEGLEILLAHAQLAEVHHRLGFVQYPQDHFLAKDTG